MIKKITQANALVFAIALVTYPSFFIFNPFQGGASVLSYIQVTSLLAALLAVALPIWGGNFYQHGNLGRSLFLLSFFLWPFTLIGVRTLSALALGDPGFGYLLSYPVFMLTDVVFPVWMLFLLVKDMVVSSVKKKLVLQSEDATSSPLSSANERGLLLD